MTPLPITRVVLYKHGVGHFEREGRVDGEQTLALTFKQSEVSDVLKSLTVLDLDGGHVASVSYDSTKPLDQLLAEVSLTIPDQGSLVSLLPQVKGARVALHTGVSDPVEGVIIGIDVAERPFGEAIVHAVQLSILTDRGDVRSFDLNGLASLQILDPGLRRDLDYYLKTQLSAKKKDARTFTFFAQGQGQRTIRLSYTLEAPVWKATYRIILGEDAQPPMIQGWAVVDNMQDEDWVNVRLSLIAGLPVSFVHDLYTPRYIRRPVVKVRETTGVLPPTMEEGMAMDAMMMEMAPPMVAGAPALKAARGGRMMAKEDSRAEAQYQRPGQSSMAAQVRERKIGDLFEYEIEHPVTIRRNQSALVPIVLRGFEGRPVLLYNKQNRAENPMRCVEFKNTTGLTLEGGPVTVLEGGGYVGEAMLETLKPDEEKLVPYAVELSVAVLDSLDSHSDRIHRVVIRQGQLIAHFIQVHKTTYAFHNKAEAEYVVYLEHPRGGMEWKLFETPDAKEVTEHFWRFRLVIPGKKTTPFIVRQRQTLQQVYGLADLGDQQLNSWLEQKYLDGKTAQALQQVMELRHEAGRLDAVIALLEQERANIHNEQQRIRDNLQSLGDRPSEKDLRERIVKTLNGQEDRLEKIGQDFQANAREREHCREKINQALASLEYDAELG